MPVGPETPRLDPAAHARFGHSFPPPSQRPAPSSRVPVVQRHPEVSAARAGTDILQREFTHKFKGDVGLVAGLTKQHDKDFAKIKEAYQTYKKATDPDSRYATLNLLVTLAQQWLRDHSAQREGANKTSDCREIVKNAQDELYVLKVAANKFEYLSSTGSAAARHKEEETHAANQLGLSTAQLTALKVYSAPDYRYINPVEHGNDAWLAGASRGMATAPKGPDGKEAHPMTAAWGMKPWRDQMKASGPTPEQAAGIKQEAQEHIAMLKPALAKMPDWQGEVYRGMGLKQEQIESEYATGKTVDFRTFASCSQKQTVAEKFAADETKDGKIGILLKITLQTGKDLETFSEVKSEKEILVPTGVTFTVSNLSAPSGDRVYYIAELLQTGGGPPPARPQAAGPPAAAPPAAAPVHREARKFGQGIYDPADIASMMEAEKRSAARPAAPEKPDAAPWKPDKFRF